MYASVTVDAWWPRQSRLVTVGTSLGDARADLSGLFMREMPRASANEPKDVLETRKSLDGSLTIEGRGAPFHAARSRLSEAVQKARARSVADGS